MAYAIKNKSYVVSKVKKHADETGGVLWTDNWQRAASFDSIVEAEEVRKKIDYFNEMSIVELRVCEERNESHEESRY